MLCTIEYDFRILRIIESSVPLAFGMEMKLTRHRSARFIVAFASYAGGRATPTVPIRDPSEPYLRS